MTLRPGNEDYRPISDYGLIGDAHSCALVSSGGSVDWACFPRFDSRAVFCRLLDKNKGGHFTVRPRDTTRYTRRYLPGTNVLETTFHTPSGTAVLTDFMPVQRHVGAGHPQEVFPQQQIARLLRCASGTVEFEAVCQPRFDYGSIVPHAVALNPHTGYAHGGADALAFYSSAPMTVEDDGFLAIGRLSAGQTAHFSACYARPTNHEIEVRAGADVQRSLEDTKRFWEQWSGQLTYEGPYREDVLRSALTLKALTYAPTGGLVAAATTSLPETIGGSRNWDYRYTWIRDA
ncbi:MAG: trehalase-like domain-containing protein, partial [Dehalococcoidia bacterium]